MTPAAADQVFEVDFNNRDGDDRVIASLRFANRWERPSVGQWVRLTDAEGDVCVGQVEEVRNAIVAIRPDWSSWVATSVTHINVGLAATSGETLRGYRLRTASLPTPQVA